MKWWKTAISLAIIAASLYAMFTWNMQGKEKIAALQAELNQAKAAADEAARIEAEKDPYEDVYKRGNTFFVIPSEWIYSRSTQVQTGSRVGIYSMELREKIGSFNVALSNDDCIEIECTVDEYYMIHDLLSENESDLLITSEARK